MNVERILGNSPTVHKIVAMRPIGSIVSMEEIKNLYVGLSKTQCVYKRASASKGSKHSTKHTKRHRGRKLFNKMIKAGFWIKKTIQ